LLPIGRKVDLRTINPVQSLETRTFHKVDLRLLPFLFGCYILAYLDRVNVGFAKLQMLKDLSMSEAAFATGAGICL
jgi:sugar phosphate permease